jgi:CHASE2 domain-containing sensor protein
MTGSVSNSDPNVQSRGRRLVVLAVLGGAIIGSLLSLFAGEFQRRLVFDTWQQTAPREVSTDNVVVVMIDDQSTKAVGEWPWRRYDIAVLLDTIAGAEPKAIGVDIFFVEPDRLRPQSFLELYTDEAIDPATRARLLQLPSGDDTLLDVIANAPVVMPWVVSKQGGRPLADLTYERVEGTPPADIASTPRMLTSLPGFDDVAMARGIVSASPDSDGITRRVPLSVRAGDAIAPGFAAQLALIASGGDVLAWTEDGLKVGDTIVPADREANFEFRMAPGWDEAAIPAIEIMRGNFESEELQGKIVLVGFGATGTTDIVASPVETETQGTLVQAQAIDAILTGNWLSRPGWLVALEIAIAAFLVALLIAAALTARNLFLVLAAITALALPFISFALYNWANLLLDPARPLVVALFAAIGLLLSRYVLTLLELVEKRIFAAEQEKENESARRLQMTMVPSAARLAKLGTRTELGAVLEPAKSVGGDFYDAMRLENDRLAFLVGDVSGKGLRAALFMALSKSVSKNNLLHMGDDLESAIRSLNDDLMTEEDEEMDLTMLVGVIDCKSGVVQLINAGHEDPMIVHADGRVDVFAMKGGLRLRTLEGFPYTTETLQLERGDTLVIITDGATDASDAKDNRFGLERVRDALRESHAASAPERAAHLARQVRMFERGTDPSDDLTIFALRYLGDEAVPPAPAT